MRTPESKLKNEVKSYLAAMPHDWLVLRLNSGVVRKGSRFIHLCPEGTADYLVANKCGCYWIELKAPGQKTAKERVVLQDAFAAKVIAMGHRHAYCSSVSDVHALLNRGEV